MAYTVISKVKSYLGISGDDYDDILLSMIEAASDTIDKFCHRTFLVKDIPETRDFDAWGTTRVRIDDLRSITSLKVDTDGDGTFGTELLEGDYLLQPANKLPKLWIDLRSTGTKLAKFPKLPQCVEITGLWGYGDSIPQPISQACIMLASRWFKRKDTAFATAVATPELGRFEVSMNVDVDMKLLLQPYRRNQGVIVP